MWTITVGLLFLTSQLCVWAHFHSFLTCPSQSMLHCCFSCDLLHLPSCPILPLSPLISDAPSLILAVTHAIHTCHWALWLLSFSFNVSLSLPFSVPFLSLAYSQYLHFLLSLYLTGSALLVLSPSQVFTHSLWTTEHIHSRPRKNADPYLVRHFCHSSM